MQSDTPGHISTFDSVDLIITLHLDCDWFGIKRLNIIIEPVFNFFFSDLISKFLMSDHF